MSLNDIDLNSTLVAGLYPTSLIETNPAATAGTASVPVKATIATASTETTTTQAATFKSLGNNQREVLILVKNTDNVFLSDAELGFLTGILGACRMSLADIALVNLSHYPGAIGKELQAVFKSKTILMFDVSPEDISLPLHFPVYQLQAFNGVTYLGAPSLASLENDKVEKSKLWVCLKKHFQL